jgi:hypothetical protein
VRAARFAIGAVGVAGIVWGAGLLRDDGLDRLQSTALWLVGVVVLHDVVLAPLVVALGVVAVKVLPRHRAIAAVGFLIWATVTLAVANVLSGLGGRPGMDSLLNRPYVSAWLVLTGLAVVGVVVTAALRARLRRARAPHP